MKKANILRSFVLFIVTVAFVHCSSFSEALETKEVEPVSINIKTEIALSDFGFPEGLQITCINFLENIRIEQEITGPEFVIEGIIPGIYSINVSGKVQNKDGIWFYMNGSLMNTPIYLDKETKTISVSGMQISPLVFKEIYFAGSSKDGKNYFRDQFYELYNNSDEELYLDGIYFGHLHPGTAKVSLPIWPSEDGDRYVYAERLWRFPGSGNEYPLKPGESCVISQFAANHQLDIYFPDSPINGFSSDFEFNMNNANFPDQPAYDMQHVFYDGKADMGRMPQYLTSVFGGAYVIFKAPSDGSYDPVNNTKLQTRDLSGTRTTLYAKVPISYVLDAVEAGPNAEMLNAKRVPAVLDAGMTYVGATYNSLGVARKKIAENEDGTPILQDTNNSTEDFDRGLKPEFRRYGAKMPSWNHTLKQ